MGKSAKGALWVDKERTSPYEIFQYLRNTTDDKVEEYLKRMTFLPLEEIAELVKHKDERINKAKEVLAYEFVSIVHGKVDADKALSQSKGAFGGNEEDMPTMNVNLTKENTVIDLLVLTNLCKSNGEARRLIQAGAVRVNDRKIIEIFDTLTSEEFNKGEIILHKGKKVHLKVTF